MDYKHVQPTQDYVLVSFERSYNDRLQLAGLSLELDTSYEPSKHLNIEGKVLAVPRFLSKLQLLMKHPGFPRPKRAITADFIASQVAWGSRRFSRDDYSLANWEPEYETLDQYEMVLQPGDTVFVDYTCLQKENIVEESPARQVYRVRYDNIIAGGRDNELFSVAGYTLVLPEMEDVKDITYEVRKKDGETVALLTAPGPKPKYLRATVALVDPGSNLDVKMGDLVWYEPHSDWENKIGDTIFYAIHERNYLAKEDMRPLGNRVIIAPAKAEDVTKSGIIIPEMAKEKPKQGKIVAVGPDCAGLTAGKDVYFASGAGVDVKFEDQDLIIMRDTDIFLEL